MVTVSNKGGNHLIFAETAGFQLGEDCRGHTWRTELITTSDNCDCKRHKKYPNSTKLSEKNIKTIAHIFVHVRHSMPDREQDGNEYSGGFCGIVFDKHGELRHCVFTHVLHVLGRKLKSDCIVPFIVTMMMIAELQNAI